MYLHIRSVLVVLLAFALMGCTRQEVVVASAPPAVTAPLSVAPEQLLDVGVVVFDPGLEELSRKSPASPGMRRAESRFMACALRHTLLQTGGWGEVRVVPEPLDSTDLTVSGRILVSNGLYLELEAEVRDSTGRVWFTDSFKGGSTRYSYEEQRLRTIDPFQSVYSAIAERMVQVRNGMDAAGLRRIRLTSEMRFARDLAPQSFRDYVLPTADGAWRIERLPADDDPMLARIRAIRERDRAFIKVLDGYYGEACEEMRQAYDALRKASYEEALALGRAERAARNNMVLGAVAVVAGVAGAAGSGSTMGQTAGAASALGGVIVAQRGLKQSEEAASHREALRELDDSFTDAVGPKVMEVEGRVITLTGSAQEQYREWRELLRDIARVEQGVPESGPARDDPTPQESGPEKAGGG